MGMDSYLYRTTSEEQEKFYRISEEVARKRSEIEKEIEKTLDDVNVYLDFLKKKYPEIAKFERDDNFRVNIEKVITKDEIAKIDEIVEKHNALKQKYYDCDFELEKADVRATNSITGERHTDCTDILSEISGISQMTIVYGFRLPRRIFSK